MPWRAVLALCIGLAAHATALDGVVVGRDGTPIAGAEIALLGFSGAARTDHEGRFQWSPEPPLPFQVLVILPDGTYMSPVLIEELPETGPLIVRVRPLVSEEIMVTGGATPSIDAPPSSGVTIVPSEDILNRQPPRLADVIASIPGASSVSDSRLSSFGKCST